MIRLFYILIAVGLFHSSANAQGCVAIRNISGFSQYLQPENAFTDAEWLININNRYFESFRDFRGKVDIETPAQNEAITKSYSLDLSATRLFNNGWSLSMAIPILANSREASSEHGGPNTTRHTTRAFGLGDIRFIAAKWLLLPSEDRKANIQLGLGLKFPTGDYKYQDYFYRNDTTRVLAPVNPGIQLGDGGLGIITELNGYVRLNDFINLYADIYYLASPRDQNGVSVLAGRTPTDIQLKAGVPETSVTDVYSLRAGVYFNLLSNLTVSAGVRNEGVPINDLFGESNGTRRPGHNLSIEPGLVYRFSRFSLYTYVPFIVSRSIDQSVPDKIITDLTGVHTSSPGGSGNYQVFLGAVIKL